MENKIKCRNFLYKCIDVHYCKREPSLVNGINTYIFYYISLRSCVTTVSGNGKVCVQVKRYIKSLY